MVLRLQIKNRSLAAVQRALKSFGAQENLPKECFSRYPAGEAPITAG